MKLPEIIEFISSRLPLFAVVYILSLLMIILDLWAGIRKAKKRGEFRSSFGLRRTVDKAVRYFNLLLALTVFDLIQMVAVAHVNPQWRIVLPVLPFCTIVGALFVCIIEIKSIYESNEKKDQAKMKDAARLAAMIASNHNVKDLAEKLAEYLKENDENSKNDENKQ